MRYTKTSGLNTIKAVAVFSLFILVFDSCSLDENQQYEALKEQAQKENVKKEESRLESVYSKKIVSLEEEISCDKNQISNITKELIQDSLYVDSLATEGEVSDSIKSLIITRMDSLNSLKEKLEMLIAKKDSIITVYKNQLSELENHREKELSIFTKLKTYTKDNSLVELNC